MPINPTPQRDCPGAHDLIATSLRSFLTAATTVRASEWGRDGTRTLAGVCPHCGARLTIRIDAEGRPQ